MLIADRFNTRGNGFIYIYSILLFSFYTGLFVSKTNWNNFFKNVKIVKTDFKPNGVDLGFLL
jgi:hypothetical protein